MMKGLYKIITAAALAAMLILPLGGFAGASGSVYTVQAGDSLWKVSAANGLTVTQLKSYNGLASDTIYPGQQLRLTPSTKYTVQSGDTLWKIAQKYGTTVAAIKELNGLTSDTIMPGRVLYIPSGAAGTVRPQPVRGWPSITYIVQTGDTASGIAAKFGTTAAKIMGYNYMRAQDWFNVGQKIAVNGYAPRDYAVLPGDASAPARVGTLVDWFRDGQYLLHRNDVFLLTDCATGLQFKVQMIGGVNHSDVEPLTAADTAVMKKLFPVWKWDPRPVVVFSNGMNIAASLSGMPHAPDTIAGNNAAGLFDMYLYNSTGHRADVSQVYVQQHQACVLKAAGR
ncbi:MAG: LysM peptidoglycan-binding domain-containing protein [Bacillota bacterium]|nr:LysM peptidoglycan-binding domain-containing protein [Bacillota bacterium]